MQNLPIQQLYYTLQLAAKKLPHRSNLVRERTTDKLQNLALTPNHSSQGILMEERNTQRRLCCIIIQYETQHQPIPSTRSSPNLETTWTEILTKENGQGRQRQEHCFGTKKWQSCQNPSSGHQNSSWWNSLQISKLRFCRFILQDCFSLIYFLRTVLKF